METIKLETTIEFVISLMNAISSEIELYNLKIDECVRNVALYPDEFEFLESLKYWAYEVEKSKAKSDELLRINSLAHK